MQKKEWIVESETTDKKRQMKIMGLLDGWKNNVFFNYQDLLSK